MLKYFHFQTKTFDILVKLNPITQFDWSGFIKYAVKPRD